MRPTFLIFLALLCFSLFFSITAKQHKHDTESDQEWEKFKAQHRKSHSKVKHHHSDSSDSSEDDDRFQIWAERLDQIKEHNSKNHSWKAGLNQYSDLDDGEFKKLLTSKHFNRKVPPIKSFLSELVKKYQSKNSKSLLSSNSERTLASYPTSLDWRAKGKVTPVKNQLYCGSCWAFSTNGALESLMLITNSAATNATANFSEQQQVNCNINNTACNGGNLGVAEFFSYVKGSASSTSYPYTSGSSGTYNQGDSKCSTLKSVFTSYGPQLVQEYSESDLIAAVNLQPVSVTLNANYMMNYAGGVYSNCTNQTEGEEANNHAVLLVGYTPTTWIIKNSWGAGWGDKGFLYLDRTNAFCTAMITQDAWYPRRAKPTADLDSFCEDYVNWYPEICSDPDYFFTMMISCFVTCKF